NNVHDGIQSRPLNGLGSGAAFRHPGDKDFIRVRRRADRRMDARHPPTETKCFRPRIQDDIP
ncbi:MAG: hypothetical protein UT30_C0033G0018, partial [Candidatus Uhrbacteria bacterium GW2011_GWF2_39_13]